jgi:hypothetical protein
LGLLSGAAPLHRTNYNEFEGGIMQGFGSFLVLIGAGSFVLHYLNMEFIVLSWVDNWGPAVGNGIRIGCIVVGAFVGRRGTQEAPPAS